LSDEPDDKVVVPLFPAREQADTTRLRVGKVPNPAGTGKTRGMAEWFAVQYRAGQDVLHEIVAAPTKELMAEQANALIEHGIPARCIKMIHSTTGKKTVRVQMTEYLRKMPPDENAILLLTHAGLQLERPNLTVDIPDPRDKEAAQRENRVQKMVTVPVWVPGEWNVWWDEAPEILSFGQMYAPRQHRFWSQLMEPERYGPGLLRLRPAVEFPYERTRGEDDYYPEDALKSIARNKPFDQHEEPVKKLCGDVANKNKLVLIMPEQWDNLLDRQAFRNKETYLHGVLDVMTVTHPAAFGDYKSVIMLGARIDNTMAVVLWDKLFGIDISEHPLGAKLERVHTTKRLAVHYVFEERATRTFLGLVGEAGQPLFSEAALAIARYMNTRKAGLPVWNAPQPGADKEHGVKNDFFASIARAEQARISNSKLI
jgi:hypothetical protein